jgi:hypothetical protein
MPIVVRLPNVGMGTNGRDLVDRYSLSIGIPTVSSAKATECRRTSLLI